MNAKQLAITFCLVISLSAANAATLEEAFQDPPDAARPWVYWWWLNGYVSEDGIVRDLDAMRKHGISGALVFHAGSGETPKATVFMSPEWREFFRFAVDEAAKRDITIGLNLCGGLNTGGPWVTPADAAKELVHGSTNLKGPQAFDDSISKPAKPKETYHDIAVLAWPIGPKSNLKSKGLLDLTDKMDAQGHLRWDVPDGHWRVVRFGWRICPKAHTK